MNTRRSLFALGLATAAGVALSSCGYPRGGGPGPGAGPWAMGPGMPGPGMMGDGPHGWMMGPGMMGGGPGGWGMGWGMGWGLGRLDLSAEQQARIAEVQADIGRRQWALMNTLHAQGGPLQGGPGPWDEAAERRAYEAMASVHRQMFDLHMEGRRRVMEVLTPAQREQLARGAAGR